MGLIHSYGAKQADLGVWGGKMPLDGRDGTGSGGLSGGISVETGGVLVDTLHTVNGGCTDSADICF